MQCVMPGSPRGRIDREASMIGGDVLKTLLSQGEEQFGKVAAQLVSNPAFVNAVQTAVTRAVAAKGFLDSALANALQGAHVPTTADMQKLNDRLDELERIFEGLVEKVDRIAAAAEKPVVKGESVTTPGAGS